MMKYRVVGRKRKQRETRGKGRGPFFTSEEKKAEM